MSVPSKIHNIPLLQIILEERLATTSELNLASSLVTGCGEAKGMGYWAATQVKGLCDEIFVVSATDVVYLTGGNTLFKSLTDQFIVPLKWGNASGGKGLVVEPFGHGHIHHTKRLVKEGGKTGHITYPVNGKTVLLKSRMRENLRSCSVRVLIAASGRMWL